MKSTLDVNQAITTSGTVLEEVGGVLTPVGGNVTLVADNGITSNSDGTITTTAMDDTGDASGQVTIDVTGTGDIALAGAIETIGADHSGLCNGGMIYG